MTEADLLDEIEPLHTGVMIALWPSSPAKYAIGSEPVDQLHITLGFLGEADDLSRGDRTTIDAATRAAANAADGPIEATVTGVDVFGDDDGGALVLLLDAPALPAVHDAVWSVLDEDEWPDQFVPWRPHMTVAYLDHVADPATVRAAAEALVGETIEIAHVGPAIAGEQHRIPLWADVSRETVQFANPYHDELGRFARKGEGRRVPTKGVEDSATIPNKTSLSGQPELKEAFTRAIYEGSKIGGNTPSAHTDQFQDILPTGFDVDGEEYDVAWSLWSRDADYPQLVFHGTITDADGRWAGDTMRAFARDLQEDSEIYAYHDRLSIRQGVQGQGIGTSFLAACEAAYVKAGINEIRLHANLDVGGYAWARAGFDFETADEAAVVVASMAAAAANEDGPDEYRQTLETIRRRIIEAGVIPTPFELSNIGYEWRSVGDDGHETWWGKEAMMDMAWDAKKILTPAVPVAVAAAAGMSRVEFLAALGALHLRHSLAHAADAPPAPDRKDGSLWNLDYWAPDEFEVEFQAAAARLLAAFRGPETFAAMKARLYAEFANPYHDELGRFAPKNTGRRVPTKGIDDDSEGVEAPRDFSKLLTGVKIGHGVLRKKPDPRVTDAISNTSPLGDFVYVSDRGETSVSIGVDGGWDLERDADFIGEILDASQGIDPAVTIRFGQVSGENDRESMAFVSSDDRNRIVFPERSNASDPDEWRRTVRDDPELFMPAAKDATFAEYVVAHEHGHVAHFRNIPDTGQGRHANEAVFISRFVDPVKAMFDEALVSPEFETHGLHEILGLSTYGVQSPYEAVAEAFVQRRLDPDNLSDEARQILEAAGV